MCILFFRERSKHHKSSKEDVERLSQLIVDGSVEEIPGFKTQIKYLFTDVSYVCMMISGSIIFGSLGGIGNTATEIVSIWGYEEVSLTFTP
jgi:hypothetical protein